jgi:hypothetical protein
MRGERGARQQLAALKASALVATSGSIAVLFAQPRFPDGTGIVQASCRSRIARERSSEP